jgi:hypothetical protein
MAAQIMKLDDHSKVSSQELVPQLVRGFCHHKTLVYGGVGVYGHVNGVNEMDATQQEVYYHWQQLILFTTVCACVCVELLCVGSMKRVGNCQIQV